MSTETREITVAGMQVLVVRKAIKNLHLAVYPPHGRVRVAAPLAVSDDAVSLAVIRRLGWIKQQQRRFEAQPRESAREMVNGESHYFMGRRYRLRVVEGTGAGRVVVRNTSIMELYVRPGANTAEREQVMERWYRQRLKELVPPLLDKWQEILGVELSGWGIRKMRTRWGACQQTARRIWLNPELAKKAPECLEYLVVHELTHLQARHHDEQFQALMDRYLPRWRLYRQELNAAPLSHALWNTKLRGGEPDGPVGPETGDP